MQPVQLGFDAQPALVKMDHLGLGHLLHQRLGEGVQLFIRPLIGRSQRRRTQGLPKEILTQLRQSIIGKQLLLVQIHHQTLKAGSILNRRTHTRWKLPPHLFAAAGTTLDLSPMLGHHQRGLW